MTPLPARLTPSVAADGRSGSTSTRMPTTAGSTRRTWVGSGGSREGPRGTPTSRGGAEAAVDAPRSGGGNGGEGDAQQRHRDPGESGATHADHLPAHYARAARGGRARPQARAAYWVW